MNNSKLKTSFLLFSSLSVALLSTHAFANTAQDLTGGYWAMQPLNNGIANVAQFKQGVASLYTFSCDFNTGETEVGETVKSTFKLTEDNTIELYDDSGELEQALKIVALSADKMTLEQAITPDFKLTFDYNKTDKLEPICPKR